MNKLIVFISLSLFMAVSVSAISVDYYYNENCGHCEKIKPFMEYVVNLCGNVDWNLLDTSKGSYNIEGTPTLVLTTNDNREITMVGSYEIPRYLECELNEQSNLNCPTYSASEYAEGSWFIRE